MRNGAEIDIWCERLENQWGRASRRRQTWMYIGIYTVIFLVTAAFVFCQFIINKQTFIGGSDGHYQMWPVLVYVGKWWSEFFRNIFSGNFAPKLFDISIGMGSGVIETLNLYGFNDPLKLLAIVVPPAYSEYLYIFIGLLRLYLSGLVFSYMCRYFKKAWTYVLIGSILYCFCGYALQSAEEWTNVTNMLIQLPLMVVGADKIIHKAKPYVFIFAVLYAALGGFYFLYMMTVMIGIYTIVSYISTFPSKSIKSFLQVVGRLVTSYLLGIGLAAVVLLPAIIAYFECSRSGGNPVQSPVLFYSADWYKTVLAVLFAPFSSFDEWNYQSYAIIGFFAILVLLFTKGKRALKSILILGFAFYLLPLGGKIMNGFSYPINRWTAGLALLLSYVVVDELPILLSLDKRMLKICLLSGMCYSVLILAMHKTSATRSASVGVAFALCSLFIFIIVHPKVQDVLLWGREHSAAFKRLFAATLCLLLVIVNVGMYGTYEFDSDSSSFSGRFPEIDIYPQIFENHMIKDMQEYLYGNPDGRADFSAQSSFRNLSMLFQVPSITYYWSIVNQYPSDFWASIETPGLLYNFNLHNSDWKTIPSALLSVKYFSSDKKGLGKTPYGYALIQEEDGKYVFENEYALPWGYTYDSAISYEDMNALNGMEKQEAMLQTIALEETEDYTEGNIVFDEQKIPYEATFNECTWENGTLTVTDKSASVTLQFEMPVGAEGFLRLNGFITDTVSVPISVICNGITRPVTAEPSTGLRNYGREHYLFDIGLCSKGCTSLTITFANNGTFQLDDIELYALPMDNYPARVEALRAEPLENIQWGTNSLTGTVDLSKDKILCVSVPYSKGWTATVDGEKVEILRGNYMFMCLPLTAGHHDIAFYYCSPGIKLGAVLTVCSAGIVIWMLVRDRKKKKTA